MTKTPEELALELVVEYAGVSWQSPLAALTKIAEKHLRQCGNERLEEAALYADLLCFATLSNQIRALKDKP